jgi:WD40 repeat protein
VLLPECRHSAVAFSPDGRWLATGTEEEFGLWELEFDTWKLARRVPREVGSDICMAFARDGHVLALLTARGALRLVDPATGREYATLQAPNLDRTEWLCISPDGGQLVAVTGNPGHVQVWDLRLIRARLAVFGLEW